MYRWNTEKLKMWADGNTKPLQGAGFRSFQSKIMGIPEDYEDDA